MKRSQKLSLAVGLIGALAGAVHGYWWWKITSSPGDDNPLGLIFAWCCLLAQFPAAGLLLALGRRFGESVAWKLWLALAAPAATLIAGVALFFTAMFTIRDA